MKRGGIVRYGFVIFSLAIGLTKILDAQVVTTPVPLSKPFRTDQSLDVLADLNSAYNSGDWQKLQQKIAEIVPKIASHSPNKDVEGALSLKRNYIGVTWIGADPFGKAALIRFVAHEPASNVFSLDLPGISDSSNGLVELLLTRTTNGRAASAYTSTREADPMTDSLPGFIQALAGPLFGTIATIKGAPEAAAKPTVFATVSLVGMPYARASVKLEAVARDPWFDRGSFSEGVVDLTTKLRFEDLSTSICGREQAQKVSARLLTIPAACQAQDDLNACKSALDTALATAYEGAMCSSGKPAGADLAAIQLVDKKFREYVTASLTNAVELKQTFKNRPLTRFTLGAGTAVMASARLTEPRVKLDNNGVIVADPLNRVMTMAFVNWSPAGYQPDAPRMSVAERLQLQFGATLTPDFGPMIGANVLLGRGIGVSSGFAVLFAKGAPQDQIGVKPANSKDPYLLSVVSAPYFGITYSYK